MSSSRAPWPPITPRGINTTASAERHNFPTAAKSPTTVARQMAFRESGQSGQNQKCQGKGCLQRMGNRFGQLTASVGKKIGLHGGRTRRTRRKTRHSRRTLRKTRRSRR